MDATHPENDYSLAALAAKPLSVLQRSIELSPRIKDSGAQIETSARSDGDEIVLSIDMLLLGERFMSEGRFPLSDWVAGEVVNETVGEFDLWCRTATRSILNTIEWELNMANVREAGGVNTA